MTDERAESQAAFAGLTLDEITWLESVNVAREWARAGVPPPPSLARAVRAADKVEARGGSFREVLAAVLRCRTVVGWCERCGRKCAYDSAAGSLTTEYLCPACTRQREELLATCSRCGAVDRNRPLRVAGGGELVCWRCVVWERRRRARESGAQEVTPRKGWTTWGIPRQATAFVLVTLLALAGLALARACG